MTGVGSPGLGSLDVVEGKNQKQYGAMYDPDLASVTI